MRCIPLLQKKGSKIHPLPQNALAYRNRGLLKELTGDLNGACRDWRKAAGLGLKKPAEWVKQKC